MKQLPREFYKLDELAEKWNLTENELFQMAAAGELTLSYSFVGKYKGIICKSSDNTSDIDINLVLTALFEGPDRYHSGYVNLFKSEARDVAAHYKDPNKLFQTTIINTISGNTVALSKPFYYSTKDLFVLCGEADRVKAERPDLFKSVTRLSPSQPLEELQALINKTPIDDYVIGTDKLLAVFGVKSFNTVVNRFKAIGIEREYTEEPIPRPKYKVTDIVKLESLKKKSK